MCISSTSPTLRIASSCICESCIRRKDTPCNPASDRECKRGDLILTSSSSRRSLLISVQPHVPIPKVKDLMGQGFNERRNRQKALASFVMACQQEVPSVRPKEIRTAWTQRLIEVCSSSALWGNRKISCKLAIRFVIVGKESYMSINLKRRRMTRLRKNQETRWHDLKTSWCSSPTELTMCSRSSIGKVMRGGGNLHTPISRIKFHLVCQVQIH